MFYSSLTKAELVLTIDSPILLNTLESTLAIANWLGDGTELNNKALAQHPYYQSIVHSIANDLDAAKKNDNKLSVTMAKSHRLFNKKWLYSKSAYYELVGIINRLDRRDFATNTCGETRLIYRLSYKTKKGNIVISSRLPLTINAVFWVKDDQQACQHAAKVWDLKKPLLAEKLIAKSGPLHPSKISLTQLKSIEVNMQAIRWPSTIRPDMGGYAEYFLRVFTLDPSHKAFQLSPLENTPAVSTINNNSVIKKSLLNYIKQPENIAKLDQGLLVIPEKYLAKKVSSHALHGLSRLANRPFDQLFSESDFSDVSFTRYKSIKTPYALLRRLNDMSCAGCHQARSIAGFHFVGKDADSTPIANSIHTATSPHFIGDIPRRRQYNYNLLNAKIPNPSRPFSERAINNEGGRGAHCSLNRDPSFTKWQCNQGLHCENINGHRHQPIGRCVTTKPTAGAACQLGVLKQHPDPLKDRLTFTRKKSCSNNHHCEQSKVGFPNGMCSSDCSNLKEGETCGSIAILYGFNRCLAANQPFIDCLSNNVRPAALMQCDLNTPCHDDYICTKTKTGAGACIPPYFLFQLRVDGHPKP
ncbi:MAG: hypothetical protein ACRBCI_06015 [Cellvibrionaceae bacterium]